MRIALMAICKRSDKNTDRRKPLASLAMLLSLVALSSLGLTVLVQPSAFGAGLCFTFSILTPLVAWVAVKRSRGRDAFAYGAAVFSSVYVVALFCPGFDERIGSKLLSTHLIGAFEYQRFVPPDPLYDWESYAPGFGYDKPPQFRYVQQGGHGVVTLLAAWLGGYVIQFLSSAANKKFCATALVGASIFSVAASGILGVILAERWTAALSITAVMGFLTLSLSMSHICTDLRFCFRAGCIGTAYFVLIYGPAMELVGDLVITTRVIRIVESTWHAEKMVETNGSPAYYPAFDDQPMPNQDRDFQRAAHSLFCVVFAVAASMLWPKVRAQHKLPSQ